MLGVWLGDPYPAFQAKYHGRRVTLGKFSLRAGLGLPFGRLWASQNLSNDSLRHGSNFGLPGLAVTHR
jgi:hypothetical protein